MGLNIALETLVSQACGVGNLDMCSVYLQGSRLISIIFTWIGLDAIITCLLMLSFELSIFFFSYIFSKILYDMIVKNEIFVNNDMKLF